MADEPSRPEDLPSASAVPPPQPQQGAPVGQSLLPFRRARPLLVKAPREVAQARDTAGEAGAGAPGTQAEQGTGAVQGEGGTGGGSSPAEQLVRPLGPSLLLRGALPGGGRQGAGEVHEAAAWTLTLEDMLVALERDTTLGRNSVVWRLHNKLLLGQPQPQQQQQQVQQVPQQVPQQVQHGPVKQES